MREAGATPGLERLRLSSIEINHVDAELVAALRETPTVSRHLHVPLQSGDDGVLRAMRRRYTTATYLRRLEPLAAELNLTTDVIVGHPAEDDEAFERTLATVEAAGISRVHVFPVLAAARYRDRGRRPRPPAREEGARRAASRALARARAAPLAGEGRRRTTSCSSTARDAATATTTRRSSSTRRSASSSASAPSV